MLVAYIYFTEDLTGNRNTLYPKKIEIRQCYNFGGFSYPLINSSNISLKWNIELRIA